MLSFTRPWDKNQNLTCLMSKFNQKHQVSLSDPLDLNPLQRATFQIVSGGASSIVEVCLMLPLDVIKTRLQLQKATVMKGPNYYMGIADAFAKIYRQEGLPAFWRGVVPLLVSDTPKRSFKFLAFEQSTPYLQFGSPHPTVLTYALAGGFAGTTEVLLQNPFEVVKVTQQANRKEQLNALRVARNIIEKDGYGLRGLYRGVTTTMARNCIFHIIYFGFFYSVRDATPPSEQAIWEFLRKLAIAYAAGALGCICSIPLDMAKTRIQGPQPVPGEIKYAWTLSTITTVCREEGVRAMYKGLLPQVLRVGPGGAILLLGYEYVLNFLVANFA